MKLKHAAAAAALAACTWGTAHAVPVALELSLVMDVSGSINSAEYDRQRLGYRNAFLDAGVQSAILSFAGAGGIAVNVIQFGTDAVEAIGWTQLTSASQINSFAALLGGLGRLPAAGSNTDVQDGIVLATSSIGSNVYTGARRVIDVSGDGHQNTDPSCTDPGNTNVVGPSLICAAVQSARDAAATAGIRINGLAIEGDYGTIGLTNWYNQNVRTSDGFVFTAAGFDDFERAVTAKVGREIVDIPEPGSMALVGLALAGLQLMRRRRATA